MILVEEHLNEELIEKAKETLEKLGFNVTRVVKYEDNFANTRWSLDDVNTIEQLGILTDEKKLEFLEYAEEQLRADMIERGWESLDVLADLFLKDEYDIGADEHEYDVFEILETGEEIFLNRFFQTNPNDIAMILAKDLEQKDYSLDEDNNIKYWYWLHDDKNNKTYRIQLFQ